VRNQAAIDEVMSFLRTVLVDETQVQFLIDSIVFALTGMNKEELFWSILGEGSNAKTSVASLIESAMGKYYYSLDQAQLTQEDRGTDSANSELANVIGKRVVFVSEVEKGHKLQAARLKKWSGGDPIKCRGLYQSAFTFKPAFSLFFSANQQNEYSHFDAAVKRRLCTIIFPVRFYKPHEKESHFKPPYFMPKDSACKDKLKSTEWRNAFLHILLDRLPHILQHGVAIPETVQNASSQADLASNPAKRWFLENYVKSNNEENRIQSSELLKKYLDETGDRGMSSVKFSDQLKCICEKKKIGGSVYFLGIVEK
jgi:phage/plasmid-associated DNA primase